MMRGMWTKQWTREGKEYWFNATSNQAQWKPPSDGVVHEAEHLVNPNTLSPEELEKYKNERAALSFDPMELMPPAVAPDSVVETAAIPSPVTSVTTTATQEAVAAPPQQHILTPAEIEDRINAVASQKHQQLLQQHKAGGNKRFKSQQSSEAGEESEYQKMVKGYTAQAGMKSDDAGKWLVR